MKRIIIPFLVMCFLFCSCARAEIQQETTGKSNTEIQIDFFQQEDDNKELFIASWLSFYELRVNENISTEKKYRDYICGLFDNMKKVKVTDVFVHIRPYADALYYSEIFPYSYYSSGKQGKKPDFDILRIITECAAEKNMKIHAWINPYRVSSVSDINSLSQDNIARIWYEEGNENTVITDKGIYFDPSSLQVQQLIIDGVREILENYDVQGIHLDDYFYFDDDSFDNEQYEGYLSQGGNLSKTAWRQENVNSLLSSLYITVKSFGEDKLFSISPGADIGKCLNEHCADVALWCSEEGYCDMIIPQIYYGFEHGTLPFERCLTQWQSLTKNSKVKLVVGLGLYKSGLEDEFALSGRNEWLENTDIISRQVKMLSEKNCDGFALYSGSYINFSETFLSEELNNLKNVL